MQLAEEDGHFILRWFFENFLIKGIDQELPYLTVKIPEKKSSNRDLPFSENEISTLQGAGKLQRQEQRAYVSLIHTKKLSE